jgi:hypothetical protein
VEHIQIVTITFSVSPRIQEREAKAKVLMLLLCVGTAALADDQCTLLSTTEEV